jgi:hypothetical protein
VVALQPLVLQASAGQLIGTYEQPPGLKHESTVQSRPSLHTTGTGWHVATGPAAEHELVSHEVEGQTLEETSCKKQYTVGGAKLLSAAMQLAAEKPVA